ncbi:MAG: hypothetical protein BJ554DRAFT_5518, partial [Olpidium bornovanus]
MEIRRQNEDLVAEINTRPARAELAASGLPREDHPFNDQRSDRSSVAGSHRRASVPSAAGPAACAQMSAPRQSVDDPALLLPPGSSARSDPSHCPEAPTSGTRPDRRDRRPLPAAPPSRGAPAQALPVDHDDVGCGQSRHSPPSPASDTSSPQQQPPLPPAHSSAGPADKTLPPAPACHGAPLPPAKHAKDKKRFSLFNGVGVLRLLACHLGATLGRPRGGPKLQGASATRAFVVLFDYLGAVPLCARVPLCSRVVAGPTQVYFPLAHTEYKREGGRKGSRTHSILRPFRTPASAQKLPRCEVNGGAPNGLLARQNGQANGAGSYKISVAKILKVGRLAIQGYGNVMKERYHEKSLTGERETTCW